jgi:hypothetical protein
LPLKPDRHRINRVSAICLLTLILVCGATEVFGADDLNLSDTVLQPDQDTARVGAEDYSGILDSFGERSDDAKLKQLLEQMKTQVNNGDEAGAESTRQEILSYIDENPEAAPYGLNEILSSSILEGLQKNGGVDVDLQSLSDTIQPTEDLGIDPAERAAMLQDLAQLFKDNPVLKDRLMDIANLINLGRNEDARALYGQIDKELFSAFLQMDPDLISKAFENLGGGIGDTGTIKPPGETPAADAPANPFPSVGELASPLSGAPVPSGAIPMVNLTNPALLLILILVPLLLLPLFTNKERFKLAMPRLASSVARIIRPTGTGPEPMEPRERIFYHFRRLIRIMGGRGVAKPNYETHREFATHCAGLPEEKAVADVSGIYEEARFTTDRITAEEADRCSRLVDSLEKDAR